MRPMTADLDYSARVALADAGFNEEFSPAAFALNQFFVDAEGATTHADPFCEPGLVRCDFSTRGAMACFHCVPIDPVPRPRKSDMKLDDVALEFFADEGVGTPKAPVIKRQAGRKAKAVKRSKSPVRVDHFEPDPVAEPVRPRRPAAKRRGRIVGVRKQLRRRYRKAKRAVERFMVRCGWLTAATAAGWVISHI